MNALMNQLIQKKKKKKEHRKKAFWWYFYFVVNRTKLLSFYNEVKFQYFLLQENIFFSDLVLVPSRLGLLPE